MINTKYKNLLLIVLTIMFMYSMSVLFLNNQNKIKVNAQTESGLCYDTVNGGYFFKVTNNINGNVAILNSKTVTRAKGEQLVNFTSSELPFLFNLSGYKYSTFQTNLKVSSVVIDEYGNENEWLSTNSGDGIAPADYYIRVMLVENSGGTVNYYNYKFDYLSVYKETPFAQKQIKYKYGSINTNEEILSALELTTLDITLKGGNKINFKEWKKATENNTVVCTAVYQSQQFRTIDYNGKYTDWNLSMLSFTDYLQRNTVSTDGAELPFSAVYDGLQITDLNTKNNNWFNSNYEISQENLYGYFFTACFPESEFEFNYYFKSNTYEGCLVYKEYPLLYKSKWYHNLSYNWGDKYQVYLLYLDGTSDTPYIAENGATDVNDTDSAFKNWWDDTDLKKTFDSLSLIFKIIVGLILLAIFAWIVYFFITAFRWIKKKNNKLNKVKYRKP